MARLKSKYQYNMSVLSVMSWWDQLQDYIASLMNDKVYVIFIGLHVTDVSESDWIILKHTCERNM